MCFNQTASVSIRRVRVIRALRRTFETGLWVRVERQGHAAIQILARSDPTPGAPPVSQKWHPSLLPTYCFGRTVGRSVKLQILTCVSYNF